MTDAPNASPTNAPDGDPDGAPDGARDDATSGNGRGRRARAFHDTLHRIARYRLVVPLKRSPHPPEHTARAVFVGVFWAFTPLVGIQMPLTFLSWLVGRKIGRDFNLIVALAWNWVTNVFTMIPTYYVFYLTGQMMLGRWDDLAGYDAFAEVWAGILQADIPFYERLETVLAEMARAQGLPLAIGWIPWAGILSPLGYRWSLRLVEAHRHRRFKARLRRERKKREREAAKTRTAETAEKA
jgi:uncharacterized protein (DUF2062 family)